MSDKERGFFKRARKFLRSHKNQDTQKAQSSQAPHEPIKRKEAQNAEPPEPEQEVIKPQESPRKQPAPINETMKRQIEQGAISRRVAQNAQTAQNAQLQQDELKRQTSQGAISRRFGPQAAHVDQDELRRQIAQGAISRRLGQASQSTSAAKGAQGGQADQDNVKRQVEQGAISRRAAPIPDRRPATQSAQGSPDSQSSSGAEGFTSRLGKLGPAGCWVAHKGLETWAKLARERNRGSTSSSDNDSPRDQRSSTPKLRPYTGPMLDTASGGAPLPTSSPLKTSSLDMRWDSRGQSSSQVFFVRKAATDSHGSPSSPLGGIQPDLYTQRNSPLFLPLSGPGPSLGRLHLRLRFDFDRSDLNIHVIEVHNLPSGDNGGFNDPYIRMEMVPKVDAKRRETSSVENTTNNPYYNEHFKFPVAYEELQNRALTFVIYDADRFSGTDFLGEVFMEMCDIELFTSIEIWAEISRIRKPREEYQELLLSLSYLPSAQRLTIVVLKARNLYVSPNKGTVDPFVKIYLLSEGKRTKKRKTGTKKGQRNPIWNEAFTFNITTKTLCKSAMELCVYDHSPEFMASHTLLGCVLLGPSEEGDAHDHWAEATQSPRKTVAMWHKLR